MDVQAVLLILNGAILGTNGIIAIFAANLKKYVETKTENLANKEDIKLLAEYAAAKAWASKVAVIAAVQSKLDLVVEQNKQIVHSSEEIKQRFTSEQKLWELKKEAVYDVVKRIGRLQNLVTQFAQAAANYHKNKTASEPVLKMKRVQD